jgi:hypothetical protein
LLLMLIVAFAVNNRVGSAFEDANPYGAQAPRGSIAEMQAEAQKEARAEMMKAVSLGLGAYISLIASLYFAGAGVKKFLVARADDAPVYEKTKRAAA